MQLSTERDTAVWLLTDYKYDSLNLEYVCTDMIQWLASSKALKDMCGWLDGMMTEWWLYCIWNKKAITTVY